MQRCITVYRFRSLQNFGLVEIMESYPMKNFILIVYQVPHRACRNAAKITFAFSELETMKAKS